MGDTKGTDSFETLEKDCDWYIVKEAECIDDLNSFENLFEESTDESVISQLIDDVDEIDQGNSLALFNKQLTDDCTNAISVLKRKFVRSPQQQSVAELSPRLQAIKITPEGKSKRRLFQDSGIEEDETTNISQVATNSIPEGASQNIDLLHCSNRRATLLAKFKELYAVSFTEITRLYKSDKTCSTNWVLAVFNAAEQVLEGSKIILKQHVEFVQLIQLGFYGLYLLTFKTAKSRETTVKMFCQMLNIADYQILCNPPKLRSVPVAMFFYKKSMSNISYKYGDFPQWLAQQILIDHQQASAETFDLSTMVQWAFDNDFLDEPAIAYNYALAAEEDLNAAAFLKSNSQAKYLRDCAIMVKHYKRYELRKMTMAEWVYKCCAETSDEGDWKPIVQFLKYQSINFIEFMIAFKPFLQGLPKKNCLVIWGPPDTGKSYFCYTLLRFLKGSVISFMNSRSHFWLSPLMDSKIGFLDDATYQCWMFMDVNLRNGLDGNPVSVDTKHRHPVQMKLPPLMVTTNIDVMADNTLLYLHSRLKCFHFPNKLPTAEDGTLVYNITNDSWACFFRKFGNQLDLNPEDGKDGDTGDTERAFRCVARRDSEYL